MARPERYEVLVLGSGTGGKLVAWHMAQVGRRTAVVERKSIGGSCPNIACMPSNNEIFEREGRLSRAPRRRVWLKYAFRALVWREYVRRTLELRFQRFM